MIYFSKVARDSYLQWLADQEKSRKSSSSRNPAPAATVTSGQVSPRATASGVGHVSASGVGHVSPARGNSPKAGCSYSQPSDSPKPGSSRSSAPSSLHPRKPDHGLGPGFHLRETASYLNGLPPDLFGKISTLDQTSELNISICRS